jgi:hypothetical protein
MTASAVAKLRLVEIKASKTGTGYLIGSGLILTCRHILQSPGGTLAASLEVRLLREVLSREGEERYAFKAARLIWPTNDKEDTGDFALLATSERAFTMEGAPLEDELYWSALPALDEAIVYAIGFPDFGLLKTAGSDARLVATERDTRPVRGRVLGGSGLKAQMYGRSEFEIVPYSEDLPENKLAWAGMSGAPVFFEENLIGIVVEANHSAAGGRLRALPVERLFNNALLRSHMEQAGFTIPQERRAAFAQLVHRLFPRADLLDHNLFARPATKEQVNRYYGGGPPGWQILAADALIERDVFRNLVDKLCESSNEARLVCILGEPGSGKSSLAWQAAYALFRTERRIILRFPNEESGYLTRLAEFHDAIRQAFIVLIDNPFKFRGFLGAIEETTLNIPVTVLTSARTNDYRRPRSSTLAILPFNLQEPSLVEKHRIVRKLDLVWNDLNHDRRRRIERANSLLFLMYELTQGTGEQTVDQIIKSTVEDLELRDKDAYEIYRYVCISWQFEVAISKAIVARMVPRWADEEIDALLGLIFENEESLGTVQAQHPELAKLAVGAKGWKTEGLLKRVPGILNVNEPKEREWLLYLCYAVARTANKDLLLKWLGDNKEWLRNFAQSESITERSLWFSVYSKLALGEQATTSAELAFSARPESDEDWRSLILLAREYRYPPPPLAAEIIRWLREHPGEWLYRSIYLEAVVKHRAKIVGFGSVLDQMLDWFGQADQNIFREHLLRAVTDFGSDEQAFKAIDKIAVWFQSATLEARLSDQREVRTAYLRLLRERATSIQAERGLNESERWLDSNPDDVRVREPFIALVRERGTPEDWNRVIEATQLWLHHHDNDQNVRAPFLKLVATRGTRAQIARAARATEEWLARHKTARDFLRLVYAKLVKRHNLQASGHSG